MKAYNVVTTLFINNLICHDMGEFSVCLMMFSQRLEMLIYNATIVTCLTG